MYKYYYATIKHAI
jgi:hypothetical protein